MRIDRRTAILSGGAAALALPAASSPMADLHLPGGPSLRPTVRDFAGKRDMIVQRVRPPMLETPRAVFDSGVFTPNDRFFVRWHWAGMPTSIDAGAFRLNIHGAVKTPLSLRLQEVVRAGESIEIAAVNQCAGNGRGLFQPRVIGAQWANGAMGNALWRGVRLRDLLDKARVTGAARHVRFTGLDTALIDGAPQFRKSLPIDKARDADVIVAFAMNGENLPLLNGYPLRLIVPGWFSTYWVKMLTDIEVLTGEDDNFWMAKAYRMPSVPVKPGDKDFPSHPVAAMPPRAFVTNFETGDAVPRGRSIELRGVALGGDCGVAKVELIGANAPVTATLEADHGSFGFRRWRATLPAGTSRFGARCTNVRGRTQPLAQAWNPSGYARDVVEMMDLKLT
ncbi:Sulfite:cytochrome c oxidoreductase subunit A [Sphingomonas antarctica]|uniref:molybdopterin-dependent oxidoreductase n=1 Tax=Sphingomonas antarctica TaxID=2040274 RepID=UPI0039EC4002